jgi:hypothetical protein
VFTRSCAVMLAACLVSSLSVAQPSDSERNYEVPRTEHGAPDFQGVWSTRFSTGLERPPGMPLVLSPEAAAGYAAAVETSLAGNTDPDIDRFGAHVLAMVDGEYRSSVITHPDNGILPFNEYGTSLSGHAYFIGRGYDGPEDRPGTERCTEAWGDPPMRAFMYQLFHGFVQSAETIAIVSEEVNPVRIIHMGEKRRPEAVTGFGGHSVGRWEGNTLVVETTHYSERNPERATIARPMLLSDKARVTERFTRTSKTELNYQFEVDDPTYYTEPWRGEFSFTREASPRLYEYACHEGNYSMVVALEGERVIEAQAARDQ